ncbi:MAG: peptidase [Chloroflexi bacterium]|nr:peptidase [Chloroflexota bacterium]
MPLLFLFLDGVGLGSDDPQINPFARAAMPRLTRLLGGRRLLLSSLSATPFPSPQSPIPSLLPLDANLGVPGLPQSATGQAVLLTGLNIPALLGYHYGPKPNPAVAAYLRQETLFSRAVISFNHDRPPAALLNAYPPRYFAGIESGRRLFSAIPMAVHHAGLALKTAADLQAGQAIAADFTAEGWRAHLNLPDTPLLTPAQAGRRLAELAGEYTFSFFEYWLSDYAGHGQEMDAALALLDTLDQVIGSLADAWQYQDALIIITSDHGNLEDLSTRRHTANPVPLLLIGPSHLRLAFLRALESARLAQPGDSAANNLTHVAPAILSFLAAHPSG